VVKREADPALPDLKVAAYLAAKRIQGEGRHNRPKRPTEKGTAEKTSLKGERAVLFPPPPKGVRLTPKEKKYVKGGGGSPEPHRKRRRNKTRGRSPERAFFLGPGRHKEPKR